MKISTTTVKDYVNTHSKEECVQEASDLIRDIETLTRSIANLIEDKKELVALLDIGVVLCVHTTAGVEITAHLGSPKGDKKAVEALRSEYEI